MPGDDPPAAKCPNVRGFYVDLHAAVLAVRARVNGRHDVIAAVDEPNRHPVDVPERFEQLPRAACQAVVTVERPLGPEDGCTLPELDGWIEELAEPRIGHAFGPGEQIVVEQTNSL